MRPLDEIAKAEGALDDARKLLDAKRREVAQAQNARDRAHRAVLNAFDYRDSCWNTLESSGASREEATWEWDRAWELLFEAIDHRDSCCAAIRSVEAAYRAAASAFEQTRFTARAAWVRSQENDK